MCVCVRARTLSCAGKDSGEIGNTGYLLGRGVGLEDRLKCQLSAEYCI